MKTIFCIGLLNSFTRKGITLLTQTDLEESWIPQADINLYSQVDVDFCVCDEYLFYLSYL